MFPGQPAENSEQLRIGDIILAANGVNLEGKTNREAINVLRDQQARVVLLVKRDPSSIPPGLLRRGSFSQNIDPNEVLSVIHSKLCKDDSRKSERSVHSDKPDYEFSSENLSYVRRESLGGNSPRKSLETMQGNGFSSQESFEDDMMGQEPGLPLLGDQPKEEPAPNLPPPSEHLSSLPPTPDDSGYLIGEDGIREAAAEVIDQRLEEDVDGSQLRLSSNDDPAGSPALFSSPDGNKKKLALDEEVCPFVD